MHVRPPIKLLSGIDLKRERIALGLTMRDLAAIVGCTQPAISQWENEKRIPTDDRLEMLSAALTAYRDAVDSIQAGRTPQADA